MIDKYYKIILYNLEKFSIPFLLKTKLENKFKPEYHTEEDNLSARRNNEKVRKRKFGKVEYLEEKTTQSNLASIRELDIDYSLIAQESSIYFQQSLEMFKTALTMNENSSPLVEYYALLQCVKGAISLEYNLTDEKFFLTRHGLSIKKGYQENRPYMFAKINDRGVFYCLVLMFCEIDTKGFPKISDFLPDSYNPQLDEVIKGYSPINTFVGSWMLSSIVRYKPKLWQKIIAGKDDDIIDEIREFRSNDIPKLVENLLNNFGYRANIPYKYGYY